MSNEDWEDLDSKSLSTIRLCLVYDVLFNIVEEDSTTILWVKLEIMYMTKYLTNKIFLKRKLYTMRITDGLKIHDHLNTFNDLVCQLTSVYAKTDDEEKEITLLCMLPDSWDHIFSSMSFSNLESFGYGIVVGALLLEEEHRKNIQENFSSAEVSTRGRLSE